MPASRAAAGHRANQLPNVKPPRPEHTGQPPAAREDFQHEGPVDVGHQVEAIALEGPLVSRSVVTCTFPITSDPMRCRRLRG